MTYLVKLDVGRCYSGIITEKPFEQKKYIFFLGAGSSLLAQPSASLRRLIGCGEQMAGCSLSAFEAPRVDSNVLMNSPVMAFVLAKRDLNAHRQKMDAAVRINTVRQYAFEVRIN